MIKGINMQALQSSLTRSPTLGLTNNWRLQTDD